MASVCMSRICLTKRPGAPWRITLKLRLRRLASRTETRPDDDFVGAEQVPIHEKVRQIGGGEMHVALLSAN